MVLLLQRRLRGVLLTDDIQHDEMTETKARFPACAGVPAAAALGYKVMRLDKIPRIASCMSETADKIVESSSARDCHALQTTRLVFARRRLGHGCVADSQLVWSHFRLRPAGEFATVWHYSPYVLASPYKRPQNAPILRTAGIQ